MNDLRTETIVESVCSMIKHIYSDKRRHMDIDTLTDYIRLKLSLPNDDDTRSRISKICAQMFEIYHGNQVIKGFYRSSRDQRVAVSPHIDKVVNERKEKVHGCPMVIDEKEIIEQFRQKVQNGSFSS